MESYKSEYSEGNRSSDSKFKYLKTLKNIKTELDGIDFDELKNKEHSHSVRSKKF